MSKTAEQLAKATASAEASVEAARRIIVALEAGKLPKLADAKILEAAGCYIRRNASKP